MARSITEIYNAIISEKETFSTLSGLTPANDNYANLLSHINSNSKVAFWRLYAYIFAVATHIHELYFDKFKTEIEAIVSKAPTGTPSWYRDQVLKYQLGDLLIYDPILLIYKYAVVDPIKRIVTHCSVQDAAQGVVLIKVAKTSSGIVPLTTPEKDALFSYLQKIKFAGTRISLSSQDADLLNIFYNIYYDPIINLDTIKSGIQTAIENYLNTLPFNGKLNLTSLTDAIQKVPGVIDPILDNVTNTPFAGSTFAIDREFLPAAGYFKVDMPIAQTMTFIPQP